VGQGFHEIKVPGRSGAGKGRAGCVEDVQMVGGEADRDPLAAVEWRLAFLTQRDLRQAGREA
jgi:hypothetical protein